MADRLDKHSLFEALWNRRVYATTGERIILDFTVNGACMGQEISLSDNRVRTLHVKVTGTGEIESVEIISMGHTIYRKGGCGKEMEFDWQDESLPEAWMALLLRSCNPEGQGYCVVSPIWVS